jgi:hypothetical protein
MDKENFQGRIDKRNNGKDVRKGQGEGARAKKKLAKGRVRRNE